MGRLPHLSSKEPEIQCLLDVGFVQGAFGLAALEIGVMSVAILVPIANIVSVMVIFSCVTMIMTLI